MIYSLGVCECVLFAGHGARSVRVRLCERGTDTGRRGRGALAAAASRVLIPPCRLAGRAPRHGAGRRGRLWARRGRCAARGCGRPRDCLPRRPLPPSPPIRRPRQLGWLGGPWGAAGVLPPSRFGAAERDRAGERDGARHGALPRLDTLGRRPAGPDGATRVETEGSSKRGAGREGGRGRSSYSAWAFYFVAQWHAGLLDGGAEGGGGTESGAGARGGLWAHGPRAPRRLSWRPPSGQHSGRGPGECARGSCGLAQSFADRLGSDHDASPAQATRAGPSHRGPHGFEPRRGVVPGLAGRGGDGSPRVRVRGAPQGKPGRVLAKAVARRASHPGRRGRRLGHPLL
mmetsp:Transcript_63244/g.142630  ORF Transcript_63244/g.142630 Transcript_63244/m.142630 type:complete len:344 (+) Transcript_63244:915-1946(+)